VLEKKEEGFFLSLSVKKERGDCYMIKMFCIGMNRGYDLVSSWSEWFSLELMYTVDVDMRHIDMMMMMIIVSPSVYPQPTYPVSPSLIVSTSTSRFRQHTCNNMLRSTQSFFYL
jgi:hypothetical protein